MSHFRIALLPAVVLATVAAGCSMPPRSTPVPSGPAGAVATGVPAQPLPGDTAEPTGPDTTSGGIEGVISSVQRAQGEGDRLGVILVEGEKNPKNQVGRAAVTVTGDTLIFEKKDGALVPATFEALEVGERVQVEFTGPILESYPVQVRAAQVTILARMPRS